jgi:hypothetical protein
VGGAAVERRADDHHVGVGVGIADLGRGLVFGGVVAGLGRVEVGKFDHDVTLALGSFADLVPPATHKKAAAVFAERLGICGDIVLISLGISYGDLGDPIAFGHSILRCSQRPPRRA